MTQELHKKAQLFNLVARRAAAQAAALGPGLAHAAQNQTRCEYLASQLDSMAQTMSAGPGCILAADLRSNANLAAGLYSEAERHRGLAADAASMAARLRHEIAGHGLRQQFAEHAALNAIHAAEAEAELRIAAALPARRPR